MKKRVKIRVTKRDIKYGKKHVAQSCPIARAVRRCTKTRFVTVCASEICVGKFHSYLPQRAANFIEKFDSRGAKAVKPFDFTITLIPDEY